MEGSTDRAALARILRHVGLTPGDLYVTDGKQKLLRSLAGYNNAARFSPWVVLVDLDGDAPCAPRFVAEVLPHPAEKMAFRVAVRAVESWLLADINGVSSFLHLPAARVPAEPDQLPDPKRALVDLAARSRKAAIREDIVPRPGSGRAVGPAYASRLTEYIQDHWEIDAAAARSPSLARCVNRLRVIQKGGA
ncbi:MAG TPA: hypothetical protein PLP31_02070 [Thermoanaerobaculaceae bacterium]|nr:hypothetical protein [Thermoanaerobaculaceae bacterium]